MVAKTTEAGFSVGLQILIGLVDRQMNRDFPAQGDRFAGRFTVIDGQVMHLAGREIQIGMLGKIVLNLVKIGFGQDRR